MTPDLRGEALTWANTIGLINIIGRKDEESGGAHADEYYSAVLSINLQELERFLDRVTNTPPTICERIKQWLGF
jgi:hypothetical protein